MTNTEILATYKGELFRFENDNGDVLIGNFSAEGGDAEAAVTKAKAAVDGYFQGKGRIGSKPEERFVRDRTYRLFGRWKAYTNRRTGLDVNQFCFTDFVEHTPHSKEGLIDYLSSHGKGRRIGPASARLLVDKLGAASVLEVCRNDIQQVMSLTGIERHYAESFAASLKQHCEVENTILELQNILGKRGFAKSLPKRLVTKYKNSAPAIIREDPYVLMQEPRVGFRLADKLWLDLGKDVRDIRRQTMCLWYILNSDRDGHVWHQAKEVFAKFHTMIGGESDARAAVLLGKDIASRNETPYGAIATMRTAGVNGPISASGDTLWLADAALAADERYIAVAIAKSKDECQVQTMTEYSEEELERREYVEHATCHRCRRPLTAEIVHILGGVPYGPTCIGYVDLTGAAETMPLADWLDRNPIVTKYYQSVASGVIRVIETSLWPDPASLQDVSEHQRAEYANATTGRIACLTGGPGTGKTTIVAAIVKAAVATGRIGLHEIAIAAPTGKASVRATQSLLDKGVRLSCRTWHSLLGVSKDEESDDWGFEHHERNPWDFRMIFGDEDSMPDVSIKRSIFSARDRGCHMMFVGDINQLAPVGPGAPFRDMMAAGLPTGTLTEIHRNDGGIVQACKDIREGKTWAHRYVDNWKSNLTILEDRTDEAKIKRAIALIDQAKVDGFDLTWETQVITAVNDKSELSRIKLNKRLQEHFNSSSVVKGAKFRDGDKVVCLENGDYLSEETKKAVYVANGEIGIVRDINETKRTMLVELQYPSRTVIVYFGTDKPGNDGSEKPGTTAWDLAYAVSCHKFQGSECGRVITMIDPYRGAQMVCDRSWMTTSISRAIDHQYLVGTAQLAEKFCRVQRVNHRKTFLRERILLAELNREVVGL
jgi:ABC-type cobalamin/Fe3+-siderophores transport system ATPase subunit